MKLRLLPVLLVLAGLLAPATAAAQANLVGAGVNMLLGRSAAERERQRDVQAAAKLAAEQDRQPEPLPPLLRTPAAQLPPPPAAEPLAALEAGLERCHAALLANPSGPICPPEQLTALQEQIFALKRTQPGLNTQPYQQELAYYRREQARRQRQAAAAGTPAPAAPVRP